MPASREIKNSRSFTFGAFTLDCARRVLECRGQPVALSSRGFDILRVLIERRDSVVTRAQLMSAVWPGLVVEEHNLSVQMSKLRRAMGEGGDSVITTVPGRGYQFVAGVVVQFPAEPSDAGPSDAGPRDAGPRDAGPRDAGPVDAPHEPGPEAAPARARAWWRRRASIAAIATVLLAAGTIAVAVALHHAPQPRLSIVVMPFRDLSDHPGSQYLADAISDDLTTDLAHLPGSRVIARETADAYAGHPVSARTIGRTLGVRYLLEGSLRSEDATLHINAQLIDTLGGGHLWSERFDIPRAGLADTRARIVGRIAGALDLAFDRVEAARAERERARDPDVVDLLYRARSTLDHDDTLSGFEAAQALLRRAVTLQPDSAEAQATLGRALLLKIRRTDDPDSQDDHVAARAAIMRAVALAPDAPDVDASLAALQLSDNRFAEAVGSAGVALAADPSNIDAQDVLATSAAAQGRIDQAADALEEIMRLNPEGGGSRIRALRLGMFRLLQGRASPAQDWLQRAIAGEPDPQPGASDWGVPEEARLLLMAACVMQGRLAEARAMYATYAEVWPHRTTWRIAALSARSMASLPGFKAMTNALQQAGMPQYADEHVDDGVASGTAMLPDKDFVPTPRNLTGARTVDTFAFETMRQAHELGLILDIGPGAAVIPGSVWERRDGGDEDDVRFVEKALRDRPSVSFDTAIAVVGDGTYGSDSYNAARRLVLSGYRHVVWYRGGEEARAAAALPASDLRQ